MGGEQENEGRRADWEWVRRRWEGEGNSCMLGGFSASCDIAGRQIFIPQTV